MNILFLLKSLEIGGLEVVTSVLANKFVKEGHNVCVYSFLGGEHSIAKRFCKQIKVYQQNNYSVCKESIQALRKIVTDNRVDVIINQWGLPYIPIKVVKKAIEGLDVKIVSVYHSAPSSNGRIQEINLALSKCNNVLQKGMLCLKRKAFRFVTSASMRYVYKNAVLRWFEEKTKEKELTPLYESMLSGDTEQMAQILSENLMETISFYDYQESYYHGFLAGMLKNIGNYIVQSNRESGKGRPDILVRYPSVRGKAIMRSKFQRPIRAWKKRVRRRCAR